MQSFTFSQTPSFSTSKENFSHPDISSPSSFFYASVSFSPNRSTRINKQEAVIISRLVRYIVVLAWTRMCVSTVAAFVFGYVMPCCGLKSLIISVAVLFVIIGLSWRVCAGWPVWTVSSMCWTRTAWALCWMNAYHKEMPCAFDHIAPFKPSLY